VNHGRGRDAAFPVTLLAQRLDHELMPARLAPAFQLIPVPASSIDLLRQLRHGRGRYQEAADASTD